MTDRFMQESLGDEPAELLRYGLVLRSGERVLERGFIDEHAARVVPLWPDASAR